MVQEQRDLRPANAANAGRRHDEPDPRGGRPASGGQE